MPPKRQLVVAVGDGGAPAPEKRPRAEPAPGGGSSSREPPQSPKHFLAIVLVVLFLKRPKGRGTISISISTSQFGRLMREQICSFINPIFSKLESKLERIEERIQDLTVKVDNIIQSSPNRHDHEPPMQEANQEGTDADAEGLATNEVEGPSTKYRLSFLNQMVSPIYHNDEIKSESDSAIRIGIYDGDSMIKSGQLSNVKVEVVALKGDFPYDALDNWTAEQFSKHRASRRDGNGDVLAGKCTVRLINGEIDLRRIKFIEGSCKTRSGMFIVAARLCEGQLPQVRVQEAIMNPVVVQDRRNKTNGKSRRPKLDDKVHLLKTIANGGTYFKRLHDSKIFTVQDFLKSLNKDPDNLAKILEIKKEGGAWKKMVGHAQECCLEGKNELKACHFSDRDVVLFFNCVHRLVGATFSNHYTSCDKFDLDQRDLVDKLKWHAYDELDKLHPTHVMTETDNFSIPIYRDIGSGAGASAGSGPSYMSNAMQGNIAAHQFIPAVQGLCRGQVNSSCAMANNDTGPSSSIPDPHIINSYLDQGTLIAGGSSSAFNSDLCQDPLGGHGVSFGTLGISNTCQFVSHEPVQVSCLQHQENTNNYVTPDVDGEIQSLLFCPGNVTLDASTSAHINMTFSPQELTITGAPVSAQGSMQSQMQTPLPPSNGASEASASAQQVLSPWPLFQSQENKTWNGSF